MSNFDPTQSGVPEVPPQFAEKAYWVRGLFEGEGARVVAGGGQYAANAMNMLLNAGEAMTPGDPTYTAIHDYLTGEPTDTFDLFNRADQFIESLTRNRDPERVSLPPLDLADLLVTAHTFTRVLGNIGNDVPEQDSAVAIERGNTLLSAAFIAAVRRTTGLEWATTQNLRPLYEALVGSRAMRPWNAFAILEGLVLSQGILGGAVRSGALSREHYDAGERNAYNRPLNENARNQLRAHSAEVIERLHLLRGYPLVSFEVAAEHVGLPWDIAVVPPLSDTGQGRAEGAIADFIFMTPNQERSGTEFEFKSVDSVYQRVTIGGSAGYMRFRLHDDGRITHGLNYHNVPNPLTEEFLAQQGAGDAFERLRALFISLAFDAVVPDEAVPSKAVGGSVGQALIPPGEREPRDDRFIKMLLRRRQVLERAGLGPENRQPSGWPPRHVRERRGYIMRMRPGYTARPTAETEAREWHREHNIRFPGLNENETWVPEKDIPGLGPESVYRRAYFRSNSETARHLGNIGVRPGRRRRRRGK
jgi:hypothetical protein